ncbi:MAG: hypothetical protein LUE93_09950 [Bacteroides sp.]|nr:hypothetical protein [Bacteroides sp.]
MKRCLNMLVLLMTYPLLIASQPSSGPLEVAGRIGDKLIRETPFKYRLEVAPNSTVFDDVQFVNFGRSLGLGRAAVAYAYTQITAEKEMEMTVQLEHNDACKLWLNGEEVYSRSGKRDIHLVYEERSVEMSFETVLRLKKGVNHLLVKSETSGKEWIFYMQPPQPERFCNGSGRLSGDRASLRCRCGPAGSTIKQLADRRSF